MTTLVIGKFMPLHRGHLALIDFALTQADRVIVLLCVEAEEPISGEDRECWLRQTFDDHPAITVRRFDFREADLPATSVSDRAISELWTARLKQLVPEADMIVGSEAYVRYVAEFWGIGHRVFDVDRAAVPVSATMIREKPYVYRNYLAPATRPDFVQRIVLHGTESTGKSTLTKRLAEEFKTVYVPETAREIVGHTDNVVFEDLLRIADRQAKAIQSAIPQADGVLFIDTDAYTTLAYGRLLFNRELPLRAEWLAAAQNDFCLFTESDAPFVQDGTRLPPPEREELARAHWRARKESGVRTVRVSGVDWQKRTDAAVATVKNFLEKGLVP